MKSTFVHTASADLITTRAQLLWSLRSFFHQEGFLEIEVPTVVVSPGLEPQLDAFQVQSTYAGSSNAHRRWLHTSPEYALKRYLAGEGQQINRVYHLGPCFRDEIPSPSHSPEFTMLEWYARDLSLEGLMNQCEVLVRTLVQTAESCGYTAPKCFNEMPFERLSVREAFLRYAQIDLLQHQDANSLRVAAQRAGIRSDGLHGDWDALYFQIFMDLVEPQLSLDHPTFLYNFPASQAALAKLDPQHPQWARRFELFAGGLELANAFDELSDPQEQRSRFKQDLELRKARDAQCPPIDEVLLDRLNHLGHCVGIALGFDRLVMLLCGVEHIDQVRLQAWAKP